MNTKYCVAPGCSNVESPNTLNNVTFHNFPDKISQREEWFEFTGNAYTTVPINAKIWKNWKICSDHFQIKDFAEEKFINYIDGQKILSRTLKDDAKPTGNYKTIKDELPSAVVEAVLNLQADISAMEDVESDPETSYMKCGEIFVSKTGSFLYLCKACNITLSNIQLFSEHICVAHILSSDQKNSSQNDTLNLNETNTLELSNDNSIQLLTNNLKQHKERIKKSNKINVEQLQQNNINLKKLPIITKIENQQDEYKILPGGDGGGNSSTSNIGNISNSCEYCGKMFKLNTSLIIHTRTHTGERPFDCQFCPSKFRSKSVLILHTRIHTGEKPYSCKYCSKTFNGKSNLYVHERIHTGAKPYQCNYCDKRFNQKSSQVTHEKIHKINYETIIKTKPKVFRCNKCNKDFLNAANLGSHNRIHQIKPENG